MKKQSNHYIDGRSTRKHKCKQCDNLVCYNTAFYGTGLCRVCASKFLKHSLDCNCCICKTKRGENKGSSKGGITLKQYYCKDCEEEIFFGTALYGKGRCLGCSNKLVTQNPERNNKISIAFTGELHPLWKGGKNRFGLCECGVRLGSYKSIRCRKCQQKTQRGSTHYSWLGGISFLPYSIKFNNELREQIRIRDNHECQLCHIRQENLDRELCIHHINYDKMNCLEENLISLCLPCHIKTNYNRIQWEVELKETMEIKERLLIGI